MEKQQEKERRKKPEENRNRGYGSLERMISTIHVNVESSHKTRKEGTTLLSSH